MLRACAEMATKISNKLKLMLNVLFTLANFFLFNDPEANYLPRNWPLEMCNGGGGGYEEADVE